MNVQSLLLDGIMLLVLGLSIYRCSQKGFLASLVSFLGTVVAVVTSLLLSRPIARLVFNTFLRDNISARVGAAIEDSLPVQSLRLLFSSLISSLPAGLSDYLSSLNIGNDIFEIFETGAPVVSGDTIVDTTFAPVIIGLLSVLVFFFFLFIANMVVKTAQRFFLKINLVPIVGTLNKFLGGLVGILPGAANIFWIYSLLTLVASFTGNKLPLINEPVLEGCFINAAFKDILFGITRYFIASV